MMKKTGDEKSRIFGDMAASGHRCRRFAGHLGGIADSE
jgi:hypothetical protein